MDSMRSSKEKGFIRRSLVDWIDSISDKQRDYLSWAPVGDSTNQSFVSFVNWSIEIFSCESENIEYFISVGPSLVMFGQSLMFIVLGLRESRINDQMKNLFEHLWSSLDWH